MKKRICTICDAPIEANRLVICEDCKQTIIKAAVEDRSIEDDVERLLRRRRRIVDWIASN